MPRSLPKSLIGLQVRIAEDHGRGSQIPKEKKTRTKIMEGEKGERNYVMRHDIFASWHISCASRLSSRWSFQLCRYSELRQNSPISQKGFERRRFIHHHTDESLFLPSRDSKHGSPDYRGFRTASDPIFAWAWPWEQDIPGRTDKWTDWHWGKAFFFCLPCVCVPPVRALLLP